ncbi:MAG TPA: hypothetical protein DD377_03120 [Firmicutes bacterium]|nr:hypothetical protein [Bacillota bacterium]
MKKILLVAADGFSKTGVPAVFMNIVRNLSKRGFSFDIIYFDERFKYYYDEFCSFGGKAYLLQKQHKTVFLKKIARYISARHYFKKTLKVLTNNGPYIAVHCFNEYRSCSFLKAAAIANVPLRIYHCNNIVRIGGNIFNRLLMAKEKKQCLKYGTTFIGCSKKAIESAFGNLVNFTIVNNPYDDSEFQFTKESVFRHDKLRLVQTSGYCDGKNQLFSLDVIAELLKKTKNVEMNFIGMDISKKYRKKIDKKICKLNLNKNVFFYNFDIEQKPIFDKCNYFLFPSKSEAFGIVLIEAQACGLKCFASDETPTEVDVGGCVRLPLLQNPKKWADAIFNDFAASAKKQSYDCSAYKNEYILYKYINLYNSGGQEE